MIPVLVGLALFRKTGKALRFLSAFLVFSVSLQIVIMMLALDGTNNLFLFHLYTPLEFAMLVIVSSLLTNVIPLRFAFVLAGVFLIYSILNALYLEPLSGFNAIARANEAIIVFFLCLQFFYKLFNAEEMVDLSKSIGFWIFTGWFIYFSGTFFLYLFSNVFSTTLTYPVIHSILYIFLNLVYSYVIWLDSRKLRS